MQRLLFMLVVLLALASNAMAAAPRISAQVDTQAEATLTAEEQRAVSIAAGRLLRHAYDAKLALDADDAERASEAIALSEQLVRLIENAVPSVKTKAIITSGDLRYEHQSTAKATTIPIHHELDMVSLAAPLLLASADDAKRNDDDNLPLGVIAHEVRHSRTTLSLDLAKAGLRAAREGLTDDDIPAARTGLAAVMHSVHFTEVTAEVPLHRAQENLMLAKAAVGQRRIVDAKALLAAVIDSLADIEETVGKMQQRTIEATREEIRAFASALGDTTPDEDVLTRIDGWWDRIAELMRQ